jgi:hypothetical protein
VILALSLQGDGKSEITPGRRATLPDELIRVGASIRELVNAGLGVALVAQSVVDAPGRPVGVHQPQPADAHPPMALIRRIAWVVPGGTGPTTRSSHSTDGGGEGALDRAVLTRRTGVATCGVAERAGRVSHIVEVWGVSTATTRTQ